MKEKSPIEKNAEKKQTDLLSEALNGASNANGYWLNASGKGYPKFYPRGVAVSPFNALFMGLHSDRNGCNSNLFVLYNDAKAMGMSVREHERGVPFLFYNWNRYINRNNPEEIISRTAYIELDEKERKQYKGVHNREVRTLFNIDQTTLPDADRESYSAALRQYGGTAGRGYTEADNRKLHIRFNDFLLKMKENLVPVRYDGNGMPHYETDRDAVYMPRQRDFEHYHDYLQETLRQIVSATGHQQRLAREGMVMKNGIPPSDDALKQERLVVEVASGIKMLELGLPARLSEESLKTVEYWNREFQENPLMMAALESDVNNALEVIRKAERGEKIEYATIRNRKHHAIADEIARHPDKDKKTIVVVRDRAAKTADVILPAGASLEVDNEVPGMNKNRIERALRKEGFGQIKFFNPDGALGFRPDDSYFSGKEVSLARLKNWEMQELSTLDVAPAVKRAGEVSFDQVQMIQDDKNGWALYIKPENGSGYSVYPDKEDVNRFFSTLKQAMDNIGKVRMELAHKYHALAETKPDLKVDLFSCGVKDIDLNRIQRVSVFKTKKDGILCAATIDGRKPEPRAVTQQQWQRMWLAEDKDGYKRNLAASLFSDVMRQGQRQGNAVETAASADREPEQREQEQRNIVDTLSEEFLSYCKDIKSKQSETIVLLKHEGQYYAYMDDAETIALELNMKVQKEDRPPFNPHKVISAFGPYSGESERCISELGKSRFHITVLDTAQKLQSNISADSRTEDCDNGHQITFRR